MESVSACSASAAEAKTAPRASARRSGSAMRRACPSRRLRATARESAKSPASQGPNSTAHSR